MPCPPLTRRSAIAALAGLAASTARSNYARAQDDDEVLPDAGSALTEMMPQAAPVLHFNNAAGESLSLTDFAGHGLVVNYWATWCGPCVAEIPSFSAVAERLAGLGILVLPVSIDVTGAQVVRPFYKLHQIGNLPMLLDPQGSGVDALNAQGIPVTIIINAAGRLVARLDGAANWNTPNSIDTLHRLAAPARPAANGGTVANDRRATI